MGDPGGIGPEIALKAVYRAKWPAGVRFVLIGCREIWQEYATRLHLPLPDESRNISDKRPARITTWEPAAFCANLARVLKCRPGKTGAPEGKASIAFIRAAVAGCLNHTFDGIVTAPICKKSIQAAGCAFPGHTEYLAYLAGSKNVAMMLIGGPLRVVLATRHLPLRRVAAALSRRSIINAAEMAARGVKWLHVPQKTIGVCALNPHAGERGALGNEEQTIISPAIHFLRKKGFAVKGPIPADVLFHKAFQNKFGAVVAMYHDQGLGPLKMIAFESGINLTLGLPFVRTSPDHGTAFDIAGKGIASYSSMVAAIRLAILLAVRHNPWQTRF